MKKSSKFLIPASLFLMSTFALIGNEGGDVAQCPTECPKPCPKPCPPPPCPKPCPPPPCPKPCPPPPCPKPCPPPPCPKPCPPPPCPKPCPPPPCKPVCAPKPDCCDTGNCGAMDHRRGPCREITPAAGPCVADGLAVIASADFIYWMARQDHIAYAYTTGTTALAAGGTPAQGRVVMPESGFKPGFKIGLGLDLDHDGWDVFAEYTWFHSNHSHSHGNRDDEDSVSATSTLDLHAPYWDVNGFNQFGTLFTSASAQWKLQMNILDLELGRNFYISESLMLRPQVGMKMTWDTQRYNTSYTNDTIVLSMNQKDTIQGYGIRAGIDTAWHFTRSFSFVGDLAFTGLWESFHVKRNDSNLVTATGISTNDLNVKSRHNNVRPIIEWRAGLRWESWWCADRYHVAIDAGWEQQVWVNQNQFFVISPTEHKNGDLSLQGLDIKVRFDF